MKLLHQRNYWGNAREERRKSGELHTWKGDSVSQHDMDTPKVDSYDRANEYLRHAV